MHIVEIKPSRLLPVLVMGVHLAAAFSFWFASAALVQGAGLALIGVSATLTWRRARSVRFRRLGLGDDGLMSFAPGSGGEGVALAPGTVVSAQAVWLRWEARAGERPGAVMMVSDQLTPADWRALQVWLRLRAGASVPPTQPV